MSAELDPGADPAGLAGSDVSPVAGRPHEKVRRLNDLSVRRFRDAEDLVARHLGEGPIIAEELLSVAGLGLDLTPSQRRVLAREEVASIIQTGFNFEAVLTTGFAFSMVTRPPEHVMSSETVYELHQVGEETRHSRVFIALLRQLAPRAVDPFSRPLMRWLRGAFVRWMVARPLFFQSLVLGGEEIPDLVQRLVAEHPATDPHLAEVAAYHRAEEARHMRFARMSFAGYHARASRVDRLAVRWLTPVILRFLWDTMVHPGVYRTAGLPAWRTWARVRRDPTRIAMRHRATRPVLEALADAGVLDARRPPRLWRDVCGIGG